MSLWAIIGLPAGFAVLSSLLLWFVAGRSRKPSFKILLLTGVVWYGLALYYAPRSMVGWPAKELPETGVLLSYKVIEPSVDPSEAGIYLWIVPKERHIRRCFFDPRNAFDYAFRNVPKSYKIPYSKQEHEDLGKADRKAKEVNGIVRFKKGKKDGKQGKGKQSGQGFEDDTNWSVLDPKEIFKKDAQETDQANGE